MIIDTTYLLPLAGIGVRMDLLRAVIEGRIKGVMLDDLALSLILGSSKPRLSKAG